MLGQLAEQLADLHAALLHVLHGHKHFVPVPALRGMQSVMGGLMYFAMRLLELLITARTAIQRLGVAVFVRAEAPFFVREDLDLAVGLAAQMAGSLKTLLLFEENLKMERLAAVGQTTGMVLHEIKNIMHFYQLRFVYHKIDFLITR